MELERLLNVVDRKTALFLAILSGVLSGVLIAGLAWYGLRYRRPQDLSEDLVSIREDLKDDPDRTEAKQAFRAEDLTRRRGYFESREKLRLGAWLLFAGLFVFALSMRRLAALGELPPVPVRPDQQTNAAVERRWTIASVLAVSGPVALAALVGLPMLRPPEAAPPSAVAAVPTGLREEEVPERLRWPGLRGPTGTGIVRETGFPLSWDAGKGVNTIWKAEVPLPGNSSPIVWGDRLFLTGADMRERKVFCLDRNTGALLWACTLRTQAVLSEDFEIFEETGPAAPTPTTDGARVYALFGTGELAAVDMNGNQLWSRWFGEPDNTYGLAGSPACHDGLLIVQLDQGGPKDGKSFLYAFEAATGRQVWKKPRPVPNSWSSPVVFDIGGRKELLTCADPWVISYDPKTGGELWRADVLSDDTGPLPAYADGMVYVAAQTSPLTAIRTGGSGDVTKTHVAWSYDEELSEVSSPLARSGMVLLATGYGVLVCLDAATGKVLWTQEFKDGFWSSPTLVGDLVHLTDLKGRTYIFELAESYRLRGTGDVGEKVVTTPAFVDAKIYIRGEKHLYCTGSKGDERTE